MYTYCSRWSSAAVSLSAPLRYLFILCALLLRGCTHHLSVWAEDSKWDLVNGLCRISLLCHSMRVSLCEKCLSFNLQHVGIGASEAGIQFLKATADLTLGNISLTLQYSFFSYLITQGFRLFVTEGFFKKNSKIRGENYRWITNCLF